jgi:mannosyl-3-phosphoglycerate phosphatase
MKPSIIIFSDLDGTLLDYNSYSFDEALPALELIRHLRIPLILVSSKTREEVLNYQSLIGLEPAPFVVENGSAIFGSGDFFRHSGNQSNTEYPDCLILGKTYAEIKGDLDEISKKHQYLIRGFHNATLAEVQAITKLSVKDAKSAMNRQFSIPLFFDERAEQILASETTDYQLKIIIGGRFMHLLGLTDKGKAVKAIMQTYRKKYGSSVIKSIALGDSLNDEAMLRAADYPVLVKKHDGTYEERIRLAGLIHSPDIGPAGWNYFLMNFLKKGV